MQPEQSSFFKRFINQIIKGLIVPSAPVSSANDELLQSAERYRSLFNRVPVGLYRTTPEGEILDASPALLEMLGYPDMESMLSLKAADIYVNSADRELEISLLKKNGIIKDFELQVYRRDGKTIWLRDNARAVLTQTGQVACYEGSLEDITQRKQMEAAERDQRALAEALRDTAAALSSTLNFDEVLERILTNVGRVVPHETANIMLVESGIARVARCLGYENPEAEAQVLLLRLAITETKTLHVMDTTGKPLIISDTKNEPGWIEIQHSKWMRSYAGAPVKVKGETIGFLNLNSAETGFFSEEHAGRLQAFADQAGVAIENARLFGEVQKYARQMALLNDITRTAISAPDPSIVMQRLADRLGELFECTGVYITLWDEENDRVIPAAAYGPDKDRYTSMYVEPDEQTMTGSVLQHGRVLVVEDLNNSPYISSRIVKLFPDKSMLALPLLADGKRLGAALISYKDYHKFTDSELILGEQVAGHIALAIYKAQLLNSERQRTEQLTRANSLILALGRVASRIEIAPDPDVVIETLGEELQHLGVKCLVTLRNSEGDLSIRYLSLDKNSLTLIEQIIGKNLGDYSISPVVFPQYELVIEKHQAVFTDDNGLVLNAALPDQTISVREKFASIIGLSEKTSWILLPLTVEEQVIGSLWIWGDNLEENLLPAASIFASQVAVALENARLYTKVQQLAITDDLTGLYNRRGLFELGRREVERAKRFEHPLSAVMIDIDKFKNFNDLYSHATGDEVLRMFSQRCRDSVREVDIVGRYGGEEFIILLPENDCYGAQIVAERLRAIIEETKIPTDDGPVSITVSIGVAEVTEDTKNLATLIARADWALHLAKAGGRNRVMVGT